MRAETAPTAIMVRDLDFTLSSNPHCGCPIRRWNLHGKSCRRLGQRSAHPRRTPYLPRPSADATFGLPNTMRLTTIPTELTTAATDLALAGLAAACVMYLSPWLSRSRWRAGLWCGALGLLCASSALGAVVHGLELSAVTQERLWAPLYLMLGLTVSLFVVAAAYDWHGVALARRLLIPMLAAGGAFYAVTRLIAGTFLVFVVYEAAAMLFALGVYLTLEAHKRLRGAGVIAVGIALNIVAATIQATRMVRFTAVWPFDHNGVFHLVQMVALVVLVGGVGLGFTSTGPATPRPATELEI